MGRAFHSGRKLFSAWSKLPLWKMYQKKFWNSVVGIDIGTFRKFWFSWSKLKNSWKWWLHRKFHIKSLTVVNRRLIVLRVEKIFMNFIIWSIGVIIWFTIPKGIEYPPWYVRQTISFELDEKMKLKTKTEMERAEPQVELSYGLKKNGFRVVDWREKRLRHVKTKQMADTNYDMKMTEHTLSTIPIQMHAIREGVKETRFQLWNSTNYVIVPFDHFNYDWNNMIAVKTPNNRFQNASTLSLFLQIYIFYPLSIIVINVNSTRT